jgi:ferrous iron transport protein B
MWDRSYLFLKRAGTVILGINILLWGLATYPKSDAITQQYDHDRVQAATELLTGRFKIKDPTNAPGEIRELIFKSRLMGRHSELVPFLEKLEEIDKAEAGERLRHSFAGRLGHLIEPLIKPMGFDWKIGIGIVSSFAAREVFVSTMSLVYNVGEVNDSDEGTQTLAQTMRDQTYPDGSPVYTTLVAVTLMVFYVFALQCVSTIAIVRRETNGWKWPVFQWLYMGALAWVLAFITYQGGRLVGLG